MHWKLAKHLPSACLIVAAACGVASNNDVCLGQSCNGACCGAQEACVAGACTSCGGLTPCGASCADTQNDPQHCGACTSACPANMFCAKGACSTGCPLHQVGCTGDAGAFCTDVRTDIQNCGACGNVCSSSQTCPNGACATCEAPTYLVCGGKCINVELDVANCGACGVICDGVCEGGRCVTQLIHEQTNSIAVDSTYVYYHYSCQLGQGGCFGALLKTSPVVTYEVTSPGQYDHYERTLWAAHNPDELFYLYNGTSVNSAWLNGGSFSSSFVGSSWPGGLASDNTFLYWFGVGGNGAAAPRSGLSVGSAIKLADVAPVGMASDGNDLYWMTSANLVGSIWHTPVAALDASAPTMLATNEKLSTFDSWQTIAVDATNVYWLAWNNAACIRAVPKGGGTVTDLYCESSGDLYDIINFTSDGLFVYFVDRKLGLYKVAAGGGSPVLLAAPKLYAAPLMQLDITGRGIAVDASSVYWTADLGPTLGGVYRVTPK